MKVLRVTMPDLSRWDVPIEVIARHRADYYADGDDRVFKEEFDFAMSSGYQIKDWAHNNMDWKDLVPHATRIKEEVTCDYDLGWHDSKDEIVDVEAPGFV